MRVKTYDLLKMAIDNQTKKLGSGYMELDFNKKSLEKVCEVIDIFVEDNDMQSIDIKIDEETLGITIYVIGPCFQFVGLANPFMEIAKHSLDVVFETQDEDNVKVGFGFDRVWNKID